MANKSKNTTTKKTETKVTEWADILGPARDFEAAVTKTRSLYDLPLVADGAKEIALLSIFKEEQRFAFEPIMLALQRLSQLIDWSHSFFVCDRVESEFFDWRKMPLRQYSSFEDFYHRELEPTWGKWEALQHTWSEVVKGKITDDEGREIILGKHGGDRRSKQAIAVQVGHKKNVSNLKRDEINTKAHWMARLDQDRPDLAAKVRTKAISATAAAIQAGFRKKVERPKLTMDKRLWRLWEKASAKERAAFLDKIRPCN